MTNRPLSDNLSAELATVGAIEFTGAPTTILMDQSAAFDAYGQMPPDLHEKLHVLSAAGTRVVVASSDKVLAGIDPATSIAILHSSPNGRAQEFAAHWNVGPDSPDSRLEGPAATNEILGLYGTAVVQERAASAFCAVGSGEPIPTRVPFDRLILRGVARQVACRRDEDIAIIRPEYTGQIVEAARDPLRLLEAIYEPITLCFTPSGSIAAAPAPRSPEDPNYWFFWQRDASQILTGAYNYALRSGDQRILREVLGRLPFLETLPAKVEAAGTDLGVSRCTVDGRPIVEYGSPQNDGPAHTALAVMAVEKDAGRALTIAKPYLDFLEALPLDAQTFDPWEFSVGEIFNTSNLARRALREAAILASRVGGATDAARYHAKELELEKHIAAFYSGERKYILAGKNHSIPWMKTISGLDIAVIGSVLTAYDVDDPFINVDDPRIIQTMEAIEAAFDAKQWPVNLAWRRDNPYGMGLGRIPEDANDGKGSRGGNPWTFATLWAAQYYCRRYQRAVHRSQEVKPEWIAKADGYLNFVLAHVPVTGLTEQIDAYTGRPRGAHKLAWAHAELMNTILLRATLRNWYTV